MARPGGSTTSSCRTGDSAAAGCPRRLASTSAPAWIRSPLRSRSTRLATEGRRPRPSCSVRAWTSVRRTTPRRPRRRKARPAGSSREMDCANARGRSGRRFRPRPSTRAGRAPGLATLARRRLAGTAAAPAARQRVRRPAPQRPPAARRSTPLLLETAVLCAATAINDEADIAWELFLSLHAVRERLVDWKPSSACARPPRPSLGPAARARRSPCLGRRSHGSAVVAVSRGRVARALAGLGAGGLRRLGRPARVP
jgi:hypothetical protein